MFSCQFTEKTYILRGGGVTSLKTPENKTSWPNEAYVKDDVYVGNSVKNNNGRSTVALNTGECYKWCHNFTVTGTDS